MTDSVYNIDVDINHGHSVVHLFHAIKELFLSFDLLMPPLSFSVKSHFIEIMSRIQVSMD